METPMDPRQKEKLAEEAKKFARDAGLGMVGDGEWASPRSRSRCSAPLPRAVPVTAVRRWQVSPREKRDHALLAKQRQGKDGGGGREAQHALGEPKARGQARGQGGGCR